jgi:hypothetical protein
MGCAVRSIENIKEDMLQTLQGDVCEAGFQYDMTENAATKEKHEVGVEDESEIHATVSLNSHC